MSGKRERICRNEKERRGRYEDGQTVCGGREIENLSGKRVAPKNQNGGLRNTRNTQN